LDAADAKYFQIAIHRHSPVIAKTAGAQPRALKNTASHQRIQTHLTQAFDADHIARGQSAVDRPSGQARCAAAMIAS
jgi:hypothetical protein